MSKKKPVVSQEEYDKVIKTIEDNSCWKFSARDDHSGAFLIPVAKNMQPYDTPKHFPWETLVKLAEVVKNKPPSLKGRV